MTCSEKIIITIATFRSRWLSIARYLYNNRTCYTLSSKSSHTRTHTHTHTHTHSSRCAIVWVCSRPAVMLVMLQSCASDCYVMYLQTRLISQRNDASTQNIINDLITFYWCAFHVSLWLTSSHLQTSSGISLPEWIFVLFYANLQYCRCYYRAGWMPICELVVRL